MPSWSSFPISYIISHLVLPFPQPAIPVQPSHVETDGDQSGDGGGDEDPEYEEVAEERVPEAVGEEAGEGGEQGFREGEGPDAGELRGGVGRCLWCCVAGGGC